MATAKYTSHARQDQNSRLSTPAIPIATTKLCVCASGRHPATTPAAAIERMRSCSSPTARHHSVQMIRNSGNPRRKLRWVAIIVVVTLPHWRCLVFIV